MAVVHYVTEDKFPLTSCGIDTNERPEVYWADEKEDVTCKTCMKIANGGMVPPKAKEKVVIPPEMEEKITLWARMGLLEETQIKMGSLLMTCRVLMGGCLYEEEMGEITAMYELVDAANFRLASASSVLRNMDKLLKKEG